MRLSPATETEEPPCPTVMDRNLYIVKSLPLRPTRFCLKITGPPGILTRISMATTSNTGHKHKRPMKAISLSKMYFRVMWLGVGSCWLSVVSKIVY